MVEMESREQLLLLKLVLFHSLLNLCTIIPTIKLMLFSCETWLYGPKASSIRMHWSTLKTT